MKNLKTSLHIFFFLIAYWMYKCHIISIRWAPYLVKAFRSNGPGNLEVKTSGIRLIKVSQGQVEIHDNWYVCHKYKGKEIDTGKNAEVEELLEDYTLDFSQKGKLPFRSTANENE